MDLFHIKPVTVPIEDRIEVAVEAILQLFMKGVACVVPLSGGKDSSITLMLAFWAAQRAKAAGKTPLLCIINADTGVEQPLVHQHVRQELAKAKAYADRLGIRAEVAITTPEISSSWLLRIVGGRAMPSFPESNSDCSSDWKVVPMQRLRKKLLSRLQAETATEATTLLGTRFSESVVRGNRMKARGDSAVSPVRNKDGELVMAPIANWTTDDVWEALALVRCGVLESFTDTEQLFRIYSDAGPTSCAVVNDAILDGQGSARGGCGARTGCWCCVKVKSDASMENLLEKPEYQYMQGLNDLRQFIVATQYDLSRRQWLGRTIKNGWVAVRPDAYHPRMMRELLRYALTLQVRENEEAMRLGIEPRFQIISPAGLFGVEAMWSLNGYHKPFTAIEDYDDVFNKGVRYEIPKLETFPKVEMPEPRFLFIGDDWDDDDNVDATWTGLRDPVGEYLWEWSKCMTTRALKNGRVVLDVNIEESFSVDEESAALALDFEVDRMLDLRKNFFRVGGYTQSYKWLLARGMISLSKGQVAVHDRFLRRTAFKERWNMCGPDYDLDELIKASEPAAMVSDSVLHAFLSEGKLAQMQAERERLVAEAQQQRLFA